MGGIAVPNDMHCFYLFHREGEVGIGEGLVLQGKVPPLSVERLEAVTEHGLSQNHAVLELLFGCLRSDSLRNHRSCCTVSAPLRRRVKGWRLSSIILFYSYCYSNSSFAFASLIVACISKNLFTNESLEASSPIVFLSICLRSSR